MGLRPYEIVITSHSSGLIECIPNTVSLDALKKMMLRRPHGSRWTLKNFFEHYFEYDFEEA